MNMRNLLYSCLVAATCSLTSIAGVTAATTVDLRIEGSTQTLFESQVSTSAGTVTSPSGGSADCVAGPLTALADAAAIGGFSWDAALYGPTYVSQIGTDVDSGVLGAPAWGSFINYIPSGDACYSTVSSGDDVLWAYDAWDPVTYGPRPLLFLSAPSQATVGQPVTVTVTHLVYEYDASYNPVLTDSGPVSGASVAGSTTDADGHASVVLANTGSQTMKAEKSGSIRSAAAEICVTTTSGSGCGTSSGSDGDSSGSNSSGESSTGSSGSNGSSESSSDSSSGSSSSGSSGSSGSGSGSSSTPDTTAPVVTIASVKRGRRYRRGRAPRTLNGTVTDAGGLATVKLRLTRRRGGRCSFFSARTRTFKPKRCSRTQSAFAIGNDAKWSYLLPRRLSVGRYTLEVIAVDRSGNRTTEQRTFTVV